jgi:DNA-binding transcriptional MerR regulator
MTVGELSRRTGVSLKTIREYEARRLIYSAGRSDRNYRLFDDTAPWCARVIDELRSLGLTLKEIEQLARPSPRSGGCSGTTAGLAAPSVRAYRASSAR